MREGGILERQVKAILGIRPVDVLESRSVGKKMASVS